MISARSPDIALTDEEKAVLATINFDALTLRGPDDVQRNGHAVRDLMKLLAAKGAIPEQRKRYFTDSRYYAGGRGRSRQQVFESNGRYGDAILSNPHFLEYAWYFLYGAKLPENAINEFRTAVKRCGDVTSSDVIPLGKTARQIARSHGLEVREASEEFYKLALDCGIDVSYAVFVRDAVRKMR